MRRLLAVPIIFLAACSSPTRPDIPPPPAQPQTVQVFDGWTDAHVSTLTARNGETVQVEQPGYLTRRQAFNGQPVFLWPSADPGFVEAIVYGNGPLKRWEQASVGVVLEVAGAEGVLDAALAEASRVSGVAFVRAAAGPVVVKVDPDDPRWSDEPGVTAYARTWWTGGRTITRSELVFRDRGWMERSNLILHEVGHALGLEHTDRRGSVMVPFANRPPTFTDAESLVLHMAYRHRRPGNMAPDSAPGAGSTAIAGSNVVVCQ